MAADLAIVVRANQSSIREIWKCLLILNMLSLAKRKTVD
jgi:hypothetical protein